MTHTVLIVDDEEDARELLKVHLKRHPDLQLVGEASNGPEALAIIEKSQPEIVLLDIQMPGMTGIEVVGKNGIVAYFCFCNGLRPIRGKSF